jgi:hypothetical protein
MPPSDSPRYLTITVSDEDLAVLDALKFVTAPLPENKYCSLAFTLLLGL